MKKKKIDAQTKKHIEYIAGQLPEVEISKTGVFQKVRGERLITMMQESNEPPYDKSGRPIDPRKDYVISLGNRKADHVKEVKAAFLSGGFAQVQKYVDAVKNKAVQQASERAHQNLSKNVEPQTSKTDTAD